MIDEGPEQQRAAKAAEDQQGSSRGSATANDQGVRLQRTSGVETNKLQ